jgi:hypothetical protein
MAEYVEVTLKVLLKRQHDEADSTAQIVADDYRELLESEAPDLWYDDGSYAAEYVSLVAYKVGRPHHPDSV